MSSPNRNVDPKEWMEYRNKQFSEGIENLSQALRETAEILRKEDYSFTTDAEVWVRLVAITQQVAFSANFFQAELELLKLELSQKEAEKEEINNTNGDKIASEIQDWLKTVE